MKKPFLAASNCRWTADRTKGILDAKIRLTQLDLKETNNTPEF